LGERKQTGYQKEKYEHELEAERVDNPSLRGRRKKSKKTEIEKSSGVRSRTSSKGPSGKGSRAYFKETNVKIERRSKQWNATRTLGNDQDMPHKKLEGEKHSVASMPNKGNKSTGGMKGPNQATNS